MLFRHVLIKGVPADEAIQLSHSSLEVHELFPHRHH